jgi:hypothetical protein
MPVEGGPALQLTRNGGTEGQESMDGRFLYFTKSELYGGPPGIWRTRVEGGEELRVHDRGWIYLWQVLEEGICHLHVSYEPRFSYVEFLDFASGEARVILEPQELPSSLGFSVSPDRRWVLYQVIQEEYDIMLVENFR